MKKNVNDKDKKPAKEKDEESKEEEVILSDESIGTLNQRILELEQESAMLDKMREPRRSCSKHRSSQSKLKMVHKVAPKVISKAKPEKYPFTAIAKATGKLLTEENLIYRLTKK